MSNSLQRPSTTLIIGSLANQAKNESHKILVVGEIGKDGTATALTLVEDVNKSKINGLFGESSQLAIALDKMLTVNPTSRVDVYPIAEGGASATADLVVTGTATETISALGIRIGGNTTSISISSGDDDVTIATAIETAYANDTVFDVTRAGTTVTFTTKSKSASINGANIVISDTVSGVTLVPTVFASGTSTVQAKTLLTDITFAERYQSIVYDSVLGDEPFYEYTESVFNLTNDIKDGIAFTTKNETLANARTEVQALNYKSLVKWYNLSEMLYNEFPFVISAEAVAIRAMRLTENAVIGDYTLGAENYGGMNKCTLPYFNTPISLSKPTGLISETDLVNLNTDGGSTFVYNGTTVLGEVMTTYKTDSTGSSDESWKFLNYVDTMVTIREFFVNNIRVRFGQTRMTDGDLVQGIDMTNKGAFKAFLLGQYSILANKGNSLQVGITRVGFEKYFANNLVIEEDLAKGCYKFTCKVPIVTQVRCINGTLLEVLDLKFTI